MKEVAGSYNYLLANGNFLGDSQDSVVERRMGELFLVESSPKLPTLQATVVLYHV